jgi:GWxTD domain-containing protein
MRHDAGFFKGFLAISFISLLALGAVRVASAQTDEPAKKGKDPNAKKKKDEVKSVYKKWIEEDVAYIITDEERRAFKALKTDEERDQFIENFWLRRDPDPDTPENEYKDTYYERIQYANEHYSSGIPGWKTDRGRIYIMYGKPDELESHPAGGPYERPSYEGGGSTSTYPFETWWYRYIEGIGSDIEIEFVDPSGSGEYRIAQNPNEKDALLYTPNAGQTLAESLGLANKSDRIAFSHGFAGAGAGTGQIGGYRAKDGEFERLKLYTDLQRPPVIKFPDLQVKADLPEIASDILPFSVRTDFMRISSESVVTSFTIQFDHQDISFKNVGGVYNGTINLSAKITALAGRKAGFFEDVVTTARYTDDQLNAGQTQRSLYQKNMVLQPGRFKIDVVARDVTSGKMGVLHHSFEVPRYKEDQLATSTLVLAASFETLDNRSLHSGPFIYGNYKVKPYVSALYKPGQNLIVFMQVYDAAMDQATLKPALKVEYIVSKGGAEVAHILEDGSTKTGVIDLKGQQLTVARQIPIKEALAQPGTYTLTVKITDLVSQKVVTPQTQFTVANR